MPSDHNLHDASPAGDPDATIRDLRIRVGLLQSELENVKREHAALKAALAQDVAALARRYLDPVRHAHAGVRHVDGVIFGGWDHVDTHAAAPEAEADPGRDSKSA